MTTAVLEAPAAPPAEGLTDDDFQLDVRVVVSESPAYNFNCPTSDGCGDTCANGASACISSIEDAA
ncbi:FxLD family lanthipeptide [Streptomyces monomycini]|uniref:FxLD family lanthipeptide n=1 Tax=Streptomyces monomycini TaxID=371720 RepID=UPI0004AAD489|nr:FxLD family lanthipeptide [Streptomyces monomycini]